jgi:hypothetical protein
MSDNRTFKIIGAAMEVQSTDYADPPVGAKFTPLNLSIL